jgi:hypothetical protein
MRKLGHFSGRPLARILLIRIRNKDAALSRDPWIALSASGAAHFLFAQVFSKSSVL